ncbi:hypothetical protein DMENIID0001_137880 [Sergentomyia squamirostris]
MAKRDQVFAIFAIVVCSFIVVPIDKHHVSAVESSRHTSHHHHQIVATPKDNVNSDIVFDDFPGVSTMSMAPTTPKIDENTTLEGGKVNKTRKGHKKMKKRRRHPLKGLKDWKERKEQKERKMRKRKLKKKALNAKKSLPKSFVSPFLPVLDSHHTSKKRVLRQKSSYDGENDDEDSDFSGSGSIPELTGDRLFQISLRILEPWKTEYSKRRSSGYKILLANLTDSLQRFFNDVLVDDQNHIDVSVRRVREGDNHQSINVIADITADQPVSMVHLSRELSRQISNYRRIGKLEVEDGTYDFSKVKGFWKIGVMFNSSLIRSVCEGCSQSTPLVVREPLVNCAMMYSPQRDLQ